MSVRKIFLVPILGVVMFIALAGSSCDSQETAATADDTNRLSEYEKMQRNQPALQLDNPYSPTRETINFWKSTWMGGPGQLAYVYLLGEDGNKIGYYIFDGPPVSYCAAISRPFTWEDIPHDGSNAHTMVPAPADDGVYYSGGQCDQYYGREAVTGAYREWSGLHYLLSTEPLPRQDVEPIGISIAEVQQATTD